MSHQTIPVFRRFQWLNHPRVTHILSTFLKPPKRGRKGYDKVLMFRWLLYRQLMNCSYRDLESMSGIDHSTFVKFKKRLMRELWFPPHLPAADFNDCRSRTVTPSRSRLLVRRNVLGTR